MENIHYGGLRLLYEKGWSFKSPPIFRGVVRYFFIQISTSLPPLQFLLFPCAPRSLGALSLILNIKQKLCNLFYYKINNNPRQFSFLAHFFRGENEWYNKLYKIYQYLITSFGLQSHFDRNIGLRLSITFPTKLYSKFIISVF